VEKQNTGRKALDPWSQVDVLLPTQLGAGARGALHEPERRLRLAVLEDAVHCFQRYAAATDRRERALHEAERAWFASTDRSEPFAFESVCDALHLDPDFVRGGLRRWQAGARALRRRSPRRVAAGPAMHADRRGRGLRTRGLTMLPPVA
jgi:hypothetical protein